jgi:uncharacterized membrane protein YhaH (DUF805 family)
MGDRVGFGARVLEQGPVDTVGPLVAWARFWTQGWRFHGRASRAEFWWVIVLEAALTGLALWIVGVHGTSGRWEFTVDPFGAVASPKVSFHLMDRGAGSWWGWGSGGRDVRPDPWDALVLAVVIGTILPRWSLLVRRLHDRDHSGAWILLLVFTGPIGWFVVMVMVARGPRPGGARFDRGVFAGRRPPTEVRRHMSA